MAKKRLDKIDWIERGEWVEVGGMGPDGHETIKMRACQGCGKAVDSCSCGRVVYFSLEDKQRQEGDGHA